MLISISGCCEEPLRLFSLSNPRIKSLQSMVSILHKSFPFDKGLESVFRAHRFNRAAAQKDKKPTSKSNTCWRLSFILNCIHPAEYKNINDVNHERMNYFLLIVHLKVKNRNMDAFVCSLLKSPDILTMFLHVNTKTTQMQTRALHSGYNWYLLRSVLRFWFCKDTFKEAGPIILPGKTPENSEWLNVI